MAFLGIDHPLVAVRDLHKAIEVYRSLGFFIAPPGQHPWGTSTALALFRHQILEIVSIGDDTLLDGYETGGFRFGRHVQGYLNKSEGVALTALFTEDAEGTQTALARRGVTCTATIDFGRDVVRADGQPDRTKTTLKVFQSQTMPRLSVFACQQHKRDLLEFPDRMIHPNGAHGFAAATIVAQNPAPVIDWFTRIHGTEAAQDAHGHHCVPTTNGHWRIVSPTEFADLYGAELDTDFLADGPRIAALDVRVSDLGQLRRFTADHALAPMETDDAIIVNRMRDLGGIAMRFIASPKTTD